MTNSKRTTFKIIVWYFKPSGKFYTEGIFEEEFTDCGQSNHPTCYMEDVVNYLKDCPKGMYLLPGLSGHTWSGPIVINCDKGYPVLLPGGIQ